MFNRAITIFLGKDNCHYTTKEKQTGTATLDDKSQVQFLSKKNPKMPFFYSRRNLYMIGFLLAFYSDSARIYTRTASKLYGLLGRYSILLARHQPIHN